MFICKYDSFSERFVDDRNKRVERYVNRFSGNLFLDMMPTDDFGGKGVRWREQRRLDEERSRSTARRDGRAAGRTGME